MTNNRLIRPNFNPRANAGHNGIVMSNGQPANPPDPLQASVMSIVAGLCRMQPLAPVAEAMLKEEAVLKEKDDLVLNQRVAVKAMQLAAKWQAEGKALVIWSQDQLQAEKDAEKAAE